jgi:transcriptional regulator with XRE-family HTH domain
MKREAFDARKREVFGDLPDYQVAERLDMDPATFSLLRNGRVQPSPKVIADVLKTFGGTFEDYFEVANQTQGSAA